MRRTAKAMVATAVTVPLSATAALAATFYGTPYGDALYGTNNADAVYGYGGADLMHGYGGNDTLYGAKVPPGAMIAPDEAEALRWAPSTPP